MSGKDQILLVTDQDIDAGVIIDCLINNDYNLNLEKLYTKKSENEYTENNTTDTVEWKVDTKYYSVILKILKSGPDLKEKMQLLEKTGALVYISSQLNNSFDDFVKISESIEEINPEVKLCVFLSHPKIDQKSKDLLHLSRKYLDFCIDNDWEFIDYESTIEENINMPETDYGKEKSLSRSSEDGFIQDFLIQNKAIIARISEAIVSNPWMPNGLQGNDNTSSDPIIFKESTKPVEKNTSVPGSDSKNNEWSDFQEYKNPIAEKSEEEDFLLLEDPEFPEDEEFKDIQEFEDLIKSLQSAKVRLKSLSRDERLSEAEKITNLLSEKFFKG
ncbi:hypothetical protein BB560_001230 [Smittium megazygosporum]|uniref:Uncharacterized protein n=1 Tax=Smittium megazygosporum TaxID=133381 RepID=A0A2T9ZI38_9FUNG|nr:hypothetical protein BB560_001230 [Smittium megazygosporum]